MKKTLNVLKKVTAVFVMLLLALSACAEEAMPEEQTAGASEPAWENILLLGVDARNFEKTDRSDSMIILSVNRDEAKAKMASIMRDTWVSFPGTSKSGKINAGTVYGGPELTIKTINAYLGTDIKSYVMVNFRDIVQIVDMLGGVDIEITDGELAIVNRLADGYTDDYKGALQLDHAGLVHMSGALALAYARDRSSTSAGDFDRVKRQRILLCAMLEAAQGKSAAELIPIVPTLMGMVKTNLTLGDVLSLVPTALDVDVDNIPDMTIPAEGTYKSGMMGGVWKIVPNFETNKSLLHDFIYNDGAALEELVVGSNGEAVRKLQNKLVEKGLLSYADGIYGNLTKAAVEEAQKQFGMEATGVADVGFQTKLFA